MALATYTIVDLNSDPVTMLGVDTGVGSAPAQRPSVFVPAGTTNVTPAPTATGDTGTGVQMANRANVKTRSASITVSIDPGLIVNG